AARSVGVVPALLALAVDPQPAQRAVVVVRIERAEPPATGRRGSESRASLLDQAAVDVERLDVAALGAELANARARAVVLVAGERAGGGRAAAHRDHAVPRVLLEEHRLARCRRVGDGDDVPVVVVAQADGAGDRTLELRE